MKLLDLTLSTPAENLACDEALLDLCEAGQGEELLRFWESQTHFVVVGYANRVWTDVDRSACEAGKIPILRRCSGGGTVLQGPGCLNYTLILKIDEAGPLRSMASASRFIMERNRAALDELLCRSRRRQAAPSFKWKNEQSLLTSAAATVQEPLVSIQGYTDLAIGGLKVSGNAQRRKRRFLLFHGTFLFQFDLSLIERILQVPSKQPEYRRNRAHQDFLSNLATTPESVKCALQQAWRAFEPLESLPREQITLLARDRYETSEWNLKFQ